jgi:hypothetical protein
MPNESFFHRNPKLLGLGRQFGQKCFLAFGLFFGQFISTHFGTVSFPLINHYYISLYQNPNIHLGFEFEYGPQRIRNCVSVVRARKHVRMGNLYYYAECIGRNVYCGSD